MFIHRVQRGAEQSGEPVDGLPVVLLRRSSQLQKHSEGDTGAVCK